MKMKPSRVILAERVAKSTNLSVEAALSIVNGIVDLTPDQCSLMNAVMQGTPIPVFVEREIPTLIARGMIVREGDEGFALHENVARVGAIIHQMAVEKGPVE